MTEPERTCVGCGRKASQEELVRFAAPTGELELDLERKLPGRGVYTCRRPSCFERAESRRAFARTLRRTVRVPSSLKASIPEE